MQPANKLSTQLQTRNSFKCCSTISIQNTFRHNYITHVKKQKNHLQWRGWGADRMRGKEEAVGELSVTKREEKKNAIVSSSLVAWQHGAAAMAADSDGLPLQPQSLQKRTSGVSTAVGGFAAPILSSRLASCLLRLTALWFTLCGLCCACGLPRLISIVLHVSHSRNVSLQQLD